MDPTQGTPIQSSGQPAPASPEQRKVLIEPEKLQAIKNAFENYQKNPKGPDAWNQYKVSVGKEIEGANLKDLARLWNAPDQIKSGRDLVQWLENSGQILAAVPEMLNRFLLVSLKAKTVAQEAPAAAPDPKKIAIDPERLQAIKAALATYKHDLNNPTGLSPLGSYMVRVGDALKGTETLKEVKRLWGAPPQADGLQLMEWISRHPHYQNPENMNALLLNTLREKVPGETAVQVTVNQERNERRQRITDAVQQFFNLSFSSDVQRRSSFVRLLTIINEQTKPEEINELKKLYGGAPASIESFFDLAIWLTKCPGPWGYLMLNSDINQSIKSFTDNLVIVLNNLSQAQPQNTAVVAKPDELQNMKQSILNVLQTYKANPTRDNYINLMFSGIWPQITENHISRLVDIYKAPARFKDPDTDFTSFFTYLEKMPNGRGGQLLTDTDPASVEAFAKKCLEVIESLK